MQSCVASGKLDDAIGDVLALASGARIDWRSPRADDDFAEYRDESFLRVVGLDHLVSDLAGFWPARGPQWDGLAITADNKVILVEAKAHVAEMVSSCHASAASRARIEGSLNQCKRRLGARESADWTTGYYQYANRLAHLQFLRDRSVDAHLLFIYFVGDPDMGRTSIAEWAAATDDCYDRLGLAKETRITGVHTLFVKVPEAPALCT